ncbi:MAG: TlpA family protein disulfide reductase [Ignavibacteriae bacterium]|nr:TlpA family protein disulfide reductase [Ignavibacteriota bacterium]
MKNFWNRISHISLAIFLTSVSCISIIVYGCKQVEQDPQTNNTPVIEKIGLEIGDEAPNFTMDNQLGKPVSLKDFRGKVVMIDFWATWCGPCVAAIPHLKELNDKYTGKDVVILGVSLDKDLDQWKSFITDEQLNWTHIADGNYWNNAASLKYNIEAIPSVWIVDRNGKITSKDIRANEAETAIEAALTK